MFLTRGQPQRGRLTNFRYGTAGTTTTTPLASQGGLLINIDSATGDTPITTSGFVEDEKYGLYAFRELANVSAEIDTAVTRTGTRTAKVSNTNASGKSHIFIGTGTSPVATTTASRSKYGIPIKASTKYKLGCWVKTNNAATSSVYISFASYTDAGVRTLNTSVKLSGTNDWTYRVVTATTGASDTTGMIGLSNDVAGNISDAWFDINSMTLEEVIEPVANSLVTPSPSLVSFTAVGSTDNIDASSSATGTGGVNLGNGTISIVSFPFLASKSKLTGVQIAKRSNAGTFVGNVTVSIQADSAGFPTGTSLASYTIPNATWNALTGSLLTTVNLPCNLTTGNKYHICVSASTSDAVNYTRLDIHATTYISSSYQANTYTGSWAASAGTYGRFVTLYYKPTTNFKASQNNLSVSVSADEDGFLDGAVLGLTTGNFSVSKTYINNTPELAKNDNYSFTTTGAVGLLEAPTAGIPIATTFGVNNLVYKINSAYALNSVTLTLTPNVSAGRSFKVQYSPDNGVTPYVDVYTYTNADTLIATSSTIAIASLSTFYLRFVAAVNICYIRSFSLSGSINTSSVNGVLKNYPTNKDIIKQYSTTLGSPTTSATYRATKWGFPAIEYSATEYQYLDVDTTGASAVVAFSELGISYTTVADGASLAISSTSTPNLFVKALITVNRLYSSSNDYVANSDKDGSLRQTLTYQVIQ